MKKNLKNVKGTQDYLEKKQIFRFNLQKDLEKEFLKSGYQPVETPILNYYNFLTSKYAGGSEITKEIYRLNDRGDRDLALRYDLTMPFIKLLLLNPTLSRPYRRFEIGKVFRDGPIKTGRYREFTQCDVDIMGVESSDAEIELLLIAIRFMKNIKKEYRIEINNRKILTGYFKHIGIPQEKFNTLLLSLDKKEKIGSEGVFKELIETKGFSYRIKDKLSPFLELNNDDLIKFLKELNNQEINEGLNNLSYILSTLEMIYPENKVIFNPYLARGLDIYTDIVYELFLENNKVTSSIGGGGRYNISNLTNTDMSYPTVGISLGLDVIVEAEFDGNIKEDIVDYYIIPTDYSREAFILAENLKDDGFNTLIELRIKKIGKALNRANTQNMKNVIIIGDKEIKNNFYTIKNMDSGIEYQVNFDFETGY